MKKSLPWHSDPPPEEHARPLCKGGCGTHLRPRVDPVYPDGSTSFTGQLPIGRRFDGKYEGYDGFHSLRCALNFARNAWNAGYRVR